MLAIVRLRNQEVFYVNAAFRVRWIERMFGVNKGCCTALFLNLRYGVQRQRRLARALWAVNLNDTTLWISTAERQIERQRARRHDLDVRSGEIRQAS